MTGSLRTVKLRQAKVRVFVSADTGAITIALIGKDQDGIPVQVHDSLAPVEIRDLVHQLGDALRLSARRTRSEA